MGLFSWFNKRLDAKEQHDVPAETPQKRAAPVAPRQPVSEWEPVPAYLPVDPHEHIAAVVIASAIAAGDRSASELKVKRVLMANPEHRLVTAIATALAAGALEHSSFTVKNIYKMKEEGSHAA